MSDTTLYHNPNCSKSRAALALLEHSTVDFKTRLYLDEPLSQQEIVQLVSLLDITPRALLRSNESVIRDQHIDIECLASDALIALMAAHPILIERPILTHGGRATIGRPIENIHVLLGIAPST